jgi:dipeptidyl aminopeptidase/acylaminoacyl peptidase
MLAAAACGGGTGSSTTSSPTTAAAPTTLPGNPTWFDDLEVGMCFDNVFRSGEFDFAAPPAVVPCHGPHDNEIAALVDLPGAGDSFPGEAAVSEAAADGCDAAYQEFLGRPLASTFLAAFVVLPDDDDWADGAHQAVCALYAEAPLVGTAAGDALTADGETLAVLSEKEGVLDLRLMDGATGRLTVDLTRGDFAHILRSQPSWAPDGSSVAFAAKPEDSGPDNDGDLYIASLDGLGILPLLEGPGEEDRPVIRPVDTVIAFISDRDGGEFDIYTIDFDAGGLVTRLMIHPDRDSSPTWSPDGSQIAFRRRAGGNSDIYVMSADGSDTRRLTNDPAFDGDPQWSPDGTQILFTTDRAGNFDIWVMNVDGSGQTPLTEHPADDEYPAWSRDGEYIAFQSTRHGVTQIWLMRSDGSEQSLLGADTPTGYPMWAPVALGG